MSDDINQPERRQRKVGEGQPETIAAERRGSAKDGIPSGTRDPAAPTNLDDIIKRLREAIAEHPLAPLYGFSDNIAALLDEIERLRMELAHEEQRVADMMADVNRVGHENERLAAELANLQIAFNDWKVMHSTVRLEVENERLREDAERYRWLRGGSDIPPHSTRWARWEVRHWNGRHWRTLYAEQADEAIDAAMAAEQAHGIRSEK